ncbi:MAG: hypothetical protein CMK36_07895 [Porticoccaceae bacterium]|nr:hypothetical protein [Porticoccaceae bacterium]|tara:strand:- start:12646 stop:13596 length:951 start_codon:yes stop_codon:yes gene_type:complete
MAIDYNQDIAPLHQQYFPMLMGERDFDQAMKYHQEVIMPMQAQTMKMEQHAMSMQAQDLANKKLNSTLMQSMQKAKNEAEAHQMIPDFVDAQLGMANDPSKDAFEKTQGIAAIYAQLPPSALTNPAITAVFGAANSMAQAQFNSEKYKQEQREKQQRLQLAQDNKREAENQKIMEAYAKSGNVKALEEMVASSPSDLGNAYLSIAGDAQKRAQLAQAEKTAEQREKEEKARFDMNIANLKEVSAMSFGDFGEGELEQADRQRINTMLITQYGKMEAPQLSDEAARRALLFAAQEEMGGTSAVTESAASKISGSMGR